VTTIAGPALYNRQRRRHCRAGGLTIHRIAVDGSAISMWRTRAINTIRRLSPAERIGWYLPLRGWPGVPQRDGIGSRRDSVVLMPLRGQQHMFMWRIRLNSTIRGTLPGSAPALLVVQMQANTGNTFMLTWKRSGWDIHTWCNSRPTAQTVWYRGPASRHPFCTGNASISDWAGCTAILSIVRSNNSNPARSLTSFRTRDRSLSERLLVHEPSGLCRRVSCWIKTKWPEMENGTQGSNAMT